jgi:ubiquinone/menaquinone biosynthesis C-methylase UbiE/uncharacterized membrane protein YbhN (UPF0104 family)
VRIAVTATLLLLIGWQVELRGVMGHLKSLHLGPLSAVVAVLGGQLLIAARRWKRLVDYVGSRPVHYGNLVRVLGISSLYGQLLPSTIGGDMVRAGMLARRVGTGPAIQSVILDRLTGLIVLVSIVLALLPLLAWRIDQTSAVAGLAVLGVAAMATLMTVVLLHDRLTRWLFRAGAQIPDLSAKLRGALFSRALAPTVIGYGLLIHLASVTLVFLLGLMVDVPLGFVDCLLVVPPALLLSAVPVSVAGWGVREGALVGGFALIAGPAAGVVTVSILYGLTTPAIGLVYAVVVTFLRDDVTEGASRVAAKGADAASACDEVISYYDRVAAEWDTTEVRKLNAVYLESRWRSLQHQLRPYEGADTAAELGVGTGAYIDRLAPMFRKLLAVDFSRGMLDVLEKRLSSLTIGNISLVQHDVCRMNSIGDGSIDLAIAMGLLDNVDDQPRLFAEVVRILRSGGGFVVATSNGRCPWYRLRDMLEGSRHCRTERYLSETQLRRLAEDAGLRVDEVDYWGTVPSGSRSPGLVKLLSSLEVPLRRTPLRCYLGGLTCRLVKP